MSETAGNSLNPFLIVVVQGTEEEPTIVPQSWLCDSNSVVMWPPGFASKNTVCKKVTPGANWIKHKVVQVYWKTATDNYQEATEYLSIAEETSGEENIAQKFAELRDRKKRKYRHHKDVNRDNDCEHDLNIIKKVKAGGLEQVSLSQTENLADGLGLFELLPEILTDQNSDQVDDMDAESNRPSTKNDDDAGIKESTTSIEISYLVANEDNGTGSKPVARSDHTSEKKRKPIIVSNERLEKKMEVKPNDRTVKIPDNTTKSAIENQGSKPVAGSDQTSEKKRKPMVVSNERLEKRMEVKPNDRTVEIPNNTTKSVIENQEPSGRTIIDNDNESDLSSDGENTSEACLKLSSTKRGAGLDSLKAALRQNIHNRTLMKNNERPGCSKTSEQARKDSTDETRQELSKATDREYSALKIDGGNNFKPEEYLELSVNEKLNILGLQQQQIIANQAKLAVAMNLKISETSTKESSLSLDETITMKGFLPIQNPDTFEGFDENLRDDKTFRAKVWKFLEPYISKTNWKETVRGMIRKVMCNEVQALYSCRGQKGKLPFDRTFFYELIEAATTKRPEKKNRAEEKQLRSYVSEYLKNAKNRLLGASTTKENGRGTRSKVSKSNPSKGKCIMSKEEKRRMALSLLNNQSVDSGDTDDSS